MAHLIETDELADLIERGDPLLRVVDMRGKVVARAEPDGPQSADYLGAREEYKMAHIPGAVYLDWTSDIADERDPIPAQIAPPEKFARVLGAHGIGDDCQVVAYDAHPASQFATRLWWALRYYGHEGARVLNGGWAKWIRECRPTTEAATQPSPATFTPRARPELRATADEVLAMLNDADTQLIDARDADQYHGRVRRGVRGGHIPGARLLYRERLFAADGTWLDPAALRRAIDEAGLDPARRCVAYCNGGIAATSVLFALSMLGFPKLTNYDGSWNEWNERLDLPIVTPGAAE